MLSLASAAYLVVSDPVSRAVFAGAGPWAILKHYCTGRLAPAIMEPGHGPYFYEIVLERLAPAISPGSGNALERLAPAYLVLIQASSVATY